MWQKSGTDDVYQIEQIKALLGKATDKFQMCSDEVLEGVDDIIEFTR